ncbi:MAG: rRNA maturation RNase YbeY [Rhizobiaceae bacterium]
MPGEVLPIIDINVDCDGWPDERILFSLTGNALNAAISTASLKFVQGSELSLLLTDDAGIRQLNKTWRNIDKPTNVLSFPGRDLEPDDTAGPMLGDIILAAETVKREAELENKPLKHHFSHLIIHGFFHLFGYDHENDEEAAVMETLESRALAKLGIGDPYADG